MFDRRFIWPAIVTFVGIVMLVVAGLTTDFISDLLLQIGSALALVAFTLLFEQWWRRRGAAEPPEPAPTPTTDPGPTSDPSDADPLELGTDELLDDALARGSVGPCGVRIRIPNSTRRLWLGRGPTGVELAVQEMDGGSKLGQRTRVKDGSRAQDWSDVLRELASDTGTENPDASALEAALTRTLRLALDARTATHANYLGELIEVANQQWALCIDGLRCLDRYYFIPRERLLESASDWPTLMAARDWVDTGLFTEAFELAVALYPNLCERGPTTVVELAQAGSRRGMS